ncbi:MAG: BPTI/Kunitz domain-containing protein [Brumimicrobium sp.]
MRNKILIPTILLGLTIIVGCSKDCEPSIPECSEKPVDAGVCMAYFESWVFDKEKNACEKISYSGCSAIGFETKEACEECECD